MNQALAVNDVPLSRQDIDAYMLQMVIRYDCRVHQNTVVEDIRIDDEGVEVDTKSGLKIRADYLADGAGY